MKKVVAYISLIVIFISIGIGMSFSYSADLVIYCSMETDRLENLNSMLDKAFPDEKIVVENMSTGTLAARLKSEGDRTSADIIIDLEYAYMEKFSDMFADVSEFNQDRFVDKYVLSDNYLPSIKSSVTVMANMDTVEKLGLAIPTSYMDLLDPVYKGHIIMPSPKASGTGYSFVDAIFSLYGEEKGWEYFDKLDENIVSYTSSGGGPASSLIRGEVAFGIGMMFQAVTAFNDGVNIKVLDIEEGVGYNLYGTSIIKGREQDDLVCEVFEFIISKWSVDDKVNLQGEVIYKNQPPTNIANWPIVTEITMPNLTDMENKERILGLWNY